MSMATIGWPEFTVKLQFLPFLTLIHYHKTCYTATSWLKSCQPTTFEVYRGLVLPAPAVPRRVQALQTDLCVVPVSSRCRCQASPARLRPGGPDTINVRRMSAHGPDSFLWPSTPSHPAVSLIRAVLLGRCCPRGSPPHLHAQSPVRVPVFWIHPGVHVDNAVWCSNHSNS